VWVRERVCVCVTCLLNLAHAPSSFPHVFVRVCERVCACESESVYKRASMWVSSSESSLRAFFFSRCVCSVCVHMCVCACVCASVCTHVSMCV